MRGIRTCEDEPALGAGGEQGLDGHGCGEGEGKAQMREGEEAIFKTTTRVRERNGRRWELLSGCVAPALPGRSRFAGLFA